MKSEAMRSAVLRDWGHRCYYCATDLRRPGGEATLAQRLPRPRGGGDARSNLVPACRACDQAKGRLSVEEFRAQVREEQPAWRAMVALSALLASERSLASPSAFRLLWACAELAGSFTFPGEALEKGAGDAGAGCEFPLVDGRLPPVPWPYGTRFTVVSGSSRSSSGVEDKPVRGRETGARR